MHIFVSTGEVSGDLQGAALVEALLRQGTAQGLNCQVTGIGGPRMAQAGAEVLADTTGIAAFGIQETLPMVLPALKLNRLVKQFFQTTPPDLLVLIDYEGFNLGFGKFCHENFPDIPIVYYIAPQFWVYSPFPSKTRTLVEITDRLLAAFPAEAKYYQKLGVSTQWVGHPLIDRIAQAADRDRARAALGLTATDLAIALLPASRPQELKLLLPEIFQAAAQIQAEIPQVSFWIPLSSPRFKTAIEGAIAQYGLNATLVTSDSRNTLAAMDLAITKCGTVSLELALLKVPQVALYRLHPVTAWIAKYIFNPQIPFIAPPNLILGETIVPELLQEQATAANIAQAALDILQNPECQAQIQQGYQRMRNCLGEPGVCDRAAAEIFALRPSRSAATSLPFR